MTESINPYQTPRHLDAMHLPIESLVFNGVIDAEDYRKMLPEGDVEWWLWIVLGILVGICILLCGSVGVLVLIFKGELFVGIGILGFCSLLMTVLWFIKLRTFSHDRTRRMLKQYPDLLGIAHGEFAASGLLFYDGMHNYYFSPRLLVIATVSKNGIRVNFEDSPYRYLAFNARIFDGFRTDIAESLKQCWVRLASSQAADQNRDYLELWNRISSPPVGAVLFQGYITIEHPMRTRTNRNTALFELTICFLSIAMAFLLRDSLETWVILGGSACVGLGLIANFKKWHSYFRDTIQESWYQNGWVSGDEFAFCNNLFGVRMPLTRIVVSEANEDLFVLTTQRGNSFHILRDSVVDEHQWNQIHDRLSAQSQ